MNTINEFPSNTTLFRSDSVYLKGHFTPAAVLACGGQIVQIAPSDAPAPPGCKTVDLGENLLTPGFLDIHTHCAAGVDVNAGEGLEKISRFFAAQGVTGWLCSILTDAPDRTLRAIQSARRFMDTKPAGARLLGIHLEGPFLAPAFKGAMPERFLRDADVSLFRQYQDAAGGAIRYVTLAPEVPGAIDLIRRFSTETTFTIGHSAADYETAIRAIDAGARAATHTFNAMRLFHHHQPAIMGAVLERPVFCEAICDGRHLHPGTVRMLLACKGYDRVVAITDSMQAAGLPDGRYKLGENDVTVERGDAMLSGTDVRAGSTLTMQQALLNLVSFTGEPVARALPLMTDNPARLLGITRKGRIAVGCDADFAVLDPQTLRVRETFVAGERVFAQA